MKQELIETLKNIAMTLVVCVVFIFATWVVSQ